MLAVESYEVGELNENGVSEFSDPATAAQFAALTSELGLAGQVGLIGQTRVIAAFRQMTAAEEFTFRTLFPVAAPVERYKGEPMPVRVLEILKRAKDSGSFKSFHVWSAEAGSGIKDPVLVAVREDSQWSWIDLLFPLARWGDALEDFPTLVKRAGALAKSRAVAALRRIQAQVAGDLAALDATPADEAASVLLVGVPTYQSALRAAPAS